MGDSVNAMTLPNEEDFRRDVQAINRFQQIVHTTLVVNQDYGIIPGTKKPTLLKPGAEKIAKLLGLADSYELVDRQENWSGTGFFRYIVKCRLTSVAHNVVISEGLGECNSMESKYRWRWIGERDLPAGIDKEKLVSQERRGNNGGHWTMYRMDNDDVFSQVNTILKMAKKRALVDAALSAGRLSEVFTQDVEDLVANGKIIDVDTTTGEVKENPVVETAEHFCKVHNVKYFKTEKMKSWAHPYEENGVKKWCNEPEQSQEQSVVNTSAPVVDAAPANDSGIPTTRQKLFQWALGHGRTYNASWVINQLGKSAISELEDAPEAIQEAWGVIKQITGWEK